MIEEGDLAVPSQKPLILVVDDDPRLLRLVKRDFALEGYQVITASDGKTALQLAENVHPDLVLLDVMLPDLDGFQVCKRMREFLQSPIMMLTAKGRTEDVVQGLDIGADEYLTKPFSIDELLARVKALLRRTKFPEEMPQPLFASGKLCIDFSQHHVTIEGIEIIITPTEYRILCLLARNAGRILTHDQLLNEIWGEEYRSDSHVLRTTVTRLRKKIRDDPSNPKYIVTRQGVGYMFKKLMQEAD